MTHWDKSTGNLQKNGETVKRGAERENKAREKTIRQWNSAHVHLGAEVPGKLSSLKFSNAHTETPKLVKINKKTKNGTQINTIRDTDKVNIKIKILMADSRMIDT